MYIYITLYKLLYIMKHKYGYYSVLYVNIYIYNFFLLTQFIFKLAYVNTKKIISVYFLLHLSHVDHNTRVYKI